MAPLAALQVEVPGLHQVFIKELLSSFPAQHV